uniref:Uncharacterized protein n=1 Tax=Parascaris equorum TaxID=6256 RepID=A0A914RFG0_PAREQ
MYHAIIMRVLPPHTTQKPSYFLSLELFLVFGLIGGAAATYSAVNELATTQFTAPCYIQPFLNTVHPSDRQRHTNCCGNWQNITRTGDSSVCNDYVDFYKQND